MDYADTIDFLFNQLPVFQVIGPGAYKPGLDTAYRLAQAFGNPHISLRTVHVGGTNGKGSTSHSIASVLMAAGLKVGLFTSPHIFDFRERIRVNGVKIAKEAVVDFVERYRNMHLDVQPSFFELTTIMAFDYFKRCGVDVAVIEVGLGGRLDTTNIITPDVAVITNVSLDHTSLLGHTEPEIAAEKAGIIKPGVPVVIGEADGEVRKVFERKAAEVAAPILFAEDTPVQYTLDGDNFVFSKYGRSIKCDLVGEFQAKNINTVLHALDFIDGVTPDAVVAGLGSVQASTGLMGRWTVVKESGPTVVCDTGHNIGAWRYLAPRLEKISRERPLRLVMGFVADKDINHIFDLLPKGAEYYFVTPSVKRGRPSSELLVMAQERGLTAQSFDNVKSGYDSAMAHSGPNDFIFVGGSNFVVADLPNLKI